MDIIINQDCDELPVGCQLVPAYNDFILNTLASIGDSPLAALSNRHYKLEGQWVAASPIHWEATHSDAMIVAIGDDLGIDDNQSRRLFHDYVQFVKDDHFNPVYHSKDLWLIRIDDKPQITSPHPGAILHQSLMPILARMDETLYWQRLFTESQMFFNQNDSKVNGLWFWSDAKQSDTRENKKVVFSDEMILTKPGFPMTRSLKEWTFARKNQTLVLANPSTQAINYYSKKTQHLRVNWFWNNLAYQSPAKSWWRTLFYAH